MKNSSPVAKAALIVSVLALVVAAGGSAYAAFKLPKNSVTTNTIKNGAVTTSKLANSAVTTSKLADGAVTASKLGPISEFLSQGTVAPGTLLRLVTVCPSGARIISGGLSVDSDTTAVQFLRSLPNGNGWEGVVFSTSAASHLVTVYALCLTQ